MWTSKVTTLVFDTESNGFVEEATQLWCICLKDVQEKTVEKFWGETMDEGLDRIMSATTIICHNLIKHDVPLIMKLYPERSFAGIEMIDTLLLSQLLNPDRYGGHGLEPKPPIDDWTSFSMDKVHRCAVDVEINYRVYNELLKEAGTEIEGVRVYG